jgi:hypothetical protein
MEISQSLRDRPEEVEMVRLTFIYQPVREIDIIAGAEAFKIECTATEGSTQLSVFSIELL